MLVTLTRIRKGGWSKGYLYERNAFVNSASVVLAQENSLVGIKKKEKNSGT